MFQARFDLLSGQLERAKQELFARKNEVRAEQQRRHTVEAESQDLHHQISLDAQRYEHLKKEKSQLDALVKELKVLAFLCALSGVSLNSS